MDPLERELIRLVGEMAAQQVKTETDAETVKEGIRLGKEAIEELEVKLNMARSTTAALVARLAELEGATPREKKRKSSPPIA